MCYATRKGVLKGGWASASWGTSTLSLPPPHPQPGVAEGQPLHVQLGRGAGLGKTTGLTALTLLGNGGSLPGPRRTPVVLRKTRGKERLKNDLQGEV